MFEDLQNVKKTLGIALNTKYALMNDMEKEIHCEFVPVIFMKGRKMFKLKGVEKIQKH